LIKLGQSKIKKLISPINIKLSKKWAPSKIISSKKIKKFGILSMLPINTHISLIYISITLKTNQKNNNSSNVGNKLLKVSKINKMEITKKLATICIPLPNLFSKSTSL
jgi:hypothetical protein